MPLPFKLGSSDLTSPLVNGPVAHAASVREDEFLFLTLAAASFVEILAGTYSENLIQHFYGDAAMTTWLRTKWQVEEVQHGEALKAYVNAVWPAFDWDAGHRHFRAEYGALCTVEQLEPQRALELIARCVIETGTATFYGALLNYVREPVLRVVLNKIRKDELAHYQHFRRHFMHLNEVNRHGPLAVSAAIYRRLRGIRNEDAFISFKNVYAISHPNLGFQLADWDAYRHQCKLLAREHYPYDMAVRMLINPVPLTPACRKLIHRPLVELARCLG